MKTIDLPPLWLLVFAAMTVLVDRVIHLPLFGGAGIRAGQLCIGVGVVLMGLAAITMLRARTTVIPHRDPAALVTHGVFSVSRNPIYLGDALVLLGVVLWRDAVLALPLVPLFMAVITWRFILPEEDRLRRAFGPQFEAWAARTRRWI
jgi:protein-S-isoprenylcysteine O-methyltransferase Ste14